MMFIVNHTVARKSTDVISENCKGEEIIVQVDQDIDYSQDNTDIVSCLLVF